MKGFDYIVTGSGSAGSIVAARLSEDPDVSVLLLEAGGRDNHPFMGMPLAFPKVATHRSFVWPFETEPEPGLNNRKLPIWRGKTLGGCSSINAMINVRGSRHDYDIWRRHGLEGWGYRDVLPYFKKLETSWRGASLYHGTDGPVGNVPVGLPEAFFPISSKRLLMRDCRSAQITTVPSRKASAVWKSQPTPAAGPARHAPTCIPR